MCHPVLVLSGCSRCRKGHGEKLRWSQAQPRQAITSDVAYFPSISVWHPDQPPSTLTHVTAKSGKLVCHAAEQILISVLAGARGRRVQVAAEHAELPPREHHRQTVGRARAHHHGARRGQERGLQPEVRFVALFNSNVLWWNSLRQLNFIPYICILEQITGSKEIM